MHYAQGFEVCKIVIPIANKNIQFRNVLHCSTSGFDHSLKIAKGLFELSHQISWGGNLPIAIAAGLPGQEKQTTPRNENTMTKSKGARQGWWIDDRFFHNMLITFR